MNKNKEEISFEEALQKIEEIVNKLEDGDMTLEKSIKEFEEGLRLYNYCNEVLDNMDGKIRMIVNKDKEEDFNIKA